MINPAQRIISELFISAEMQQAILISDLVAEIVKCPLLPSIHIPVHSFGYLIY